MKKAAIPVYGYIAGLMFLLSCITIDITQQAKQSHKDDALIFPEPYNVPWIYRKLENLYTLEKAESILQNLQPYLYQYRNNDILAKAESLKLEHDAVKIGWEWEEVIQESVTQTSTTSVEKDITGDVVKAIFSRNKADITSALINALTPPPSQTTTTGMVISKKVTKHNNTIFMFEDVSNLFIFQDNFVNVKLKSGEEINIIINNDYYRSKWCDALLSIIRHKKYDRDFFLGAILRKQELPKEIIKKTGIEGALVLGVIKNSPADEVGLAYKDIITRVDNVKVISGLDVENYIKRTKKFKKNDRINFEIVNLIDDKGIIQKKTFIKKINVTL